MIRINWKKILLVVTDLGLAVYIGFAVSSWNKPTEKDEICSTVNIDIEDENENGFLNTKEVKELLLRKNLYPFSKHKSDIDVRNIEEELRNMPFVKTANCCLTQDGHANISLTQRTPIIRVKAENGNDYYIDDAGGVMPNSQYTSDMIIVTGKVSQQYACKYITHLATTIMADKFWQNQIEQINVLPDNTIEFIPRVGEHIINIGPLPICNNKNERPEVIANFTKEKFHQMEIFYKYGLANAGWDRYSYISLEFANQVVCTKKDYKE